MIGWNLQRYFLPDCFESNHFCNSTCKNTEEELVSEKAAFIAFTTTINTLNQLPLSALKISILVQLTEEKFQKSSSSDFQVGLTLSLNRNILRS